MNHQLKIVDNLQYDILLWFCQLKIVDNLQDSLLLPKISIKQMLTGLLQQLTMRMHVKYDEYEKCSDHS